MTCLLCVLQTGIARMSQNLVITPVMHPAADTVDSSEEDMPLSALAGRHTSGSQSIAHAPQAQTQAQPQARAQNQSQDQAGAQAPAAPALPRVARSRKADKPDAKPGLRVPSKVAAPMKLSSPTAAVITGTAADADVPAGADTAAAHQGSPESAPAVVTAAAAEEPAKNDNAAARQGSPEPAPAPAPVEVRTTRSQSRRMSMEASPSITTSVMTRSALKGQSGGQAAMTKLLPAGRKRSATPAYPPAAPEASPMAAAATSASGDAQGGPAVSNKKRRSGSVDDDSKQAVAPRRSSRLSVGRTASTPDSSQPPELTQVSEQKNAAEHSAAAVEPAVDTTAAKAVAEPSARLQARGAPADGPAQAASDDLHQFDSRGPSHQQDAPGAQAAAGPAQAAEVLPIAEPRVQLLPAPSGEAVTEAAAARSVDGSSPQAAATEPQAAGPAAATTATTGDLAEPHHRHTGKTIPGSLPVAPASSGGHLDASTAELPADDVDQLALVQPVTSARTSPEVDAKGDTACPAVEEAADALSQPEATTGAVMPGSAGMAAVANPSPIPVTATAEAVTTSSVEAAATAAAAAAGPVKTGASTKAVPSAAADSANTTLAEAVSKATLEDISNVPAAESSKAAATASAADTSEDVSTRAAETASRGALTVAATASEDISVMPAAAASRAPSALTAEAAVKAPPLVKLPGTTRIGLPSRPGLLGKSGLAGLGPSGGSTHIGPALSQGLLSALPTKAKASSETRQSTSAGSAGKATFFVNQHCEMTCVQPCVQLQVCSFVFSSAAICLRAKVIQSCSPNPCLSSCLFTLTVLSLPVVWQPKVFSSNCQPMFDVCRPEKEEICEREHRSRLCCKSKVKPCANAFLVQTLSLNSAYRQCSYTLYACLLIIHLCTKSTASACQPPAVIMSWGKFLQFLCLTPRFLAQ